TFTTATAGSNGYLAFGTPYDAANIVCWPSTQGTYVLAPYWADQCTTGCGLLLATAVESSPLPPARLLTASSTWNFAPSTSIRPRTCWITRSPCTRTVIRLSATSTAISSRHRLPTTASW